MHRDVLVPLLEELFAARAVDVWIAAMGAAGIPCAPINDVGEALDRPAHRRARAVAETGTRTGAPCGRCARRCASARPGTTRAPARGGPAMGEHTGRVLRGIGYDDERLAALRDAGAFGTHDIGFGEDR